MALDYIRHTDITLRTLSQVHIGNGDKLSSVGDYLITSKSLYFLDNDRLLRDIEQAGRTADFVKALRAFQTGFDFAGTLEEWGINHGDYHTREIPLHQSGEITTSNNLLYRCVGIPVTDNRYQLPYIPGSTLKGLLRTAIIFQYYR
ncbi:MAG: type III-A CRISPR-associated RAMP protein Csm5, partial [Bacteroidota bacterium]